jgi:hydrogenase maturation factor HypF (carbamoyltransferase family)
MLLSDALKPEDKARSWLNYVLLDLVQCAHHVCTINGIKRLVFVGGFFNNQLIRQITTAELARRNLMQMLMAQVKTVSCDQGFIQPPPEEFNISTHKKILFNWIRISAPSLPEIE